MIFFTSDLHFGHENIIKLTKRPFKDVQEMDETLIKNWNAVVSPADTVYVLGDFAYRLRKRLHDYTSALNGTRHLILGNHDRLPRVEYERNFHSVQSYLELDIGKNFIVLFHYPILSWNRRARGSWHLYGHVHTAGQMPPIADQRTCNVSTDVHNFTPVSYDTLAQTMIARNVKVTDP